MCHWRVGDSTRNVLPAPIPAHGGPALGYEPRQLWWVAGLAPGQVLCAHSAYTHAERCDFFFFLQNGCVKLTSGWVFPVCVSRSKCACHQLTVQATGCTPGGQINPNSGYQHKRLEECLPTG